MLIDAMINNGAAGQAAQRSRGKGNELLWLSAPLFAHCGLPIIELLSQSQQPTTNSIEFLCKQEIM